MISKPPIARPVSSPEALKDRPVFTPEPVERPISDLPKPNLAPPTEPKETWWGAIRSLLFWLIAIGLCMGGWFYREAWWPWFSKQIGIVESTAAGAKKAPRPPVPVVTAIVQQKDMDVFINGLGTVTAFKTVTIRSRVEGELVKVAFKEGQIVEEGSLLAEIDRRPFDVQLQQAQGQLARDEATLKSADFTFKRYQELILSKSITAQQVDEQRALVQQMAGAIQSDQAAVENAKLQLAYCHITAPISGRIGLRLVDQGNIVRANDPMGLAVITQLQPISLVFTIPQDDISRVQKPQNSGQPLSVDAYDRDFKIKLASGKLLAIDNQVDSTTGTVRLKAVFDNEDGMLFPNQFVNARLLVDTKRNAIVVPASAVQRGPTSVFLYVVQEDDTVDLRTVKVGLSEGSEISIESGLTPGEIVVTEGIDKLQPKAMITTLEKEKEKERAKENAAAEKKGSNEKSPDIERKKSEGTDEKPKTKDGKGSPENSSGKKGST
ncbi:MAG: MdtA/MuxA family multidrug efflux RND transporter periplasmic adaptor subunit [Schlesneria sp.]